ncbi:hypothetical protein AC578_647 [Pseudocercospora eumusae]|uniref:Uncharacterized protein n=1 Tax=Pseudocercospora eumusae TaxID=321146 RepID=A0A139HKM6_9PEZI|nr:hypothetical protein AC578_647 [Pseudocercospora eumusae]
MAVPPHIKRQLAEKAAATTNTKGTSRSSSPMSVGPKVSGTNEVLNPKHHTSVKTSSSPGIITKQIGETKRDRADIGANDQAFNNKIMASAPPLIRCSGECGAMKHKSRFAPEDLRAIVSPRVRASSSQLVTKGIMISCVGCQLAAKDSVASKDSSVPPKAQEPPLLEEATNANTDKEENVNTADIETDEDGFVRVNLSELEKEELEYDMCDLYD